MSCTCSSCSSEMTQIARNRFLNRQRFPLWELLLAYHWSRTFFAIVEHITKLGVCNCSLIQSGSQCIAVVDFLSLILQIRCYRVIMKLEDIIENEAATRHSLAPEYVNAVLLLAYLYTPLTHVISSFHPHTLSQAYFELSLHGGKECD